MLASLRPILRVLVSLLLCCALSTCGSRPRIGPDGAGRGGTGAAWRRMCRSTGTARRGRTSSGRRRSPARDTPRRSSGERPDLPGHVPRGARRTASCCASTARRPASLWQQTVVDAPLEKKHRLNSYASQHAGHRRQAGLRHVPRPRPRCSWPPTTSRASGSGWFARASSPATTAIAARRVLFENW